MAIALWTTKLGFPATRTSFACNVMREDYRRETYVPSNLALNQNEPPI